MTAFRPSPRRLSATSSAASAGFDCIVAGTPGSPIPTPFLATGDGPRRGLHDVVLDDVQRRRRRQASTPTLTGATAAEQLVRRWVAVVFDRTRACIYETPANNGDFGFGTHAEWRRPARSRTARCFLGADVNSSCSWYDYNDNSGNFEAWRRSGEARPSGSSRAVAPLFLGARAGPAVNSSIPAGYVDQISGGCRFERHATAHKDLGSDQDPLPPQPRRTSAPNAFNGGCS